MRLLMACLALSAMLPVSAALPESAAMRDAGALRWTCGGVGADARRALAEARAGANLEVVFASAKRGAYLADADLSVYGKGGGAPLLEIRSAGPICLIAAPAGEYRLQARLAGVSRERVVRVPGPGHAAARIVLSFPDEPWDGIRASEEEKRQAREP